MIVGIAGKIGAGKDTVAAWLVEHAEFTRLGFADALSVVLALPLVVAARKGTP